MNPEETMTDVFRWLGVDDGFLPSNLSERTNETPSVVQQVRGQGWVHGFRHSALWNAIGPKVPSALRRAARGLSDRPIEHNALDPAGRLSIICAFGNAARPMSCRLCFAVLFRSGRPAKDRPDPHDQLLATSWRLAHFGKAEAIRLNPIRANPCLCHALWPRISYGKLPHPPVARVR